VRLVVDVVRLESLLKAGPPAAGTLTEIFEQYNLALTRSVASGQFLRWFESVN